MEDILASMMPDNEKVEMLSEIIIIQRNEIKRLKHQLSEERSNRSWEIDQASGHTMGR